MADIIALIVIAAVIAAAVAYIVKAKRSGVKCIGCPAGGSCQGSKAPKKRLEGRVIGRKTLTISGMHCQHCAAAVTQALNGINGVSAEADAAKGRAKVAFDRQVSDELLKNAVEEAGYHVTGIS